jgi:hypothetical protein
MSGHRATDSITQRAAMFGRREIDSITQTEVGRISAAQSAVWSGSRSLGAATSRVGWKRAQPVFHHSASGYSTTRATAAEQGSGERRGLEYHFAFTTALPGGGMLHIFVPEKQVIIITAYLLPRKWPEGAASETMRAAQHAFLFAYIDAIRPGVQ